MKNELNKGFNDLSKIIQELLLVIIASIIKIIIEGFILMKLWAWIIVDAFHVQNITLVQAAGINFILYILKNKKLDDNKKDNKKPDFEGSWKSIKESFQFGILFLVIGWLITSFINP